MPKLRATIREVAQAAQTSIATVSRHLNTSGYVDAETALRIDAAVVATGYAPNLFARSLKGGSLRLLRLEVANLQDRFQAEFTQALQRMAQVDGYAMLLACAVDEESASPLGQAFVASGIVQVGMPPSSVEAADAACPTVGVLDYGEDARDRVIGVRHDATRLTTAHLLQLGHRRIAFVGGDARDPIQLDRKEGYRLALQRQGMPMDPSLLCEGCLSVDDGRRMAQRLIAQQPTAICCAGDDLAIGVLTALAAQGVHVPGQVSVTGVGDVAAAPYLRPSLTTAALDAKVCAEQAFALLMRRMKAPEAARETITVPWTLHQRVSTAVPNRR